MFFHPFTAKTIQDSGRHTDDVLVTALCNISRLWIVSGETSLRHLRFLDQGISLCDHLFLQLLGAITVSANGHLKLREQAPVMLLMWPNCAEHRLSCSHNLTKTAQNFFT